MSELVNPHYCPCCGEPMPETEPGASIDAPCPCIGPISMAPASLHLLEPPRRQVVAKARRAKTSRKRPAPTVTRSRRPDPAPVAGSASTVRAPGQVQSAQLPPAPQLVRLAA